MAAICEAWGLRLEYPENWTVDDAWVTSQGEAGPPQLVIAGPETAFWQLTRHPPGTPLEPLFDEALAALRAEYRDIEVALAHRQVEGHDVEGYDVNFFCLDLTVTVGLRGLRQSDATYLIVCQAEDREWPLAGQVFDAMLVSLLRGQDR